ncbi:hypothetical protein AAFF_G00084340 [Aldrovandia affinis]|uniref:Uncharacterized protein n=1 Tax=Aldrovandia affinis TaxID=143900 RepID=A0AAD7R1G2_9TELE|nr:hypothetical protein AAFF_G00084340 [Aldrovandia affinis]
MSLSEEEVSSLLSSCGDWDSGLKQRAASLAGHLSQLVPPGLDMFSSLSSADLQSHQRQDPTINRVLHFVERKQRPSRCERDKENQMVMRILKQWDKLTVLDGILYRVTRDPVTKHKRFQFVLPDSLKSQALAGVHDQAGHQGQLVRCLLSVSAFSGMMWRRMCGAMSGTVPGANFQSELIAELLELAGVGQSPDLLTTLWGMVAPKAKPQFHIYKIRDRDGQVKTVHRNLLLAVNFLPLDNTLFAEDDLRSVDTVSHDPSNVPDPEAAVSEPESVAEHSVVDSSSWLNVSERNRTASWVCDQSCTAEVESVNGVSVGRASSPTVSVPSTDATALPSPPPVPLSHALPLTGILPQGPENSVL